MRIFLAGATGATGLVFEPMATKAGHSLLLHVRPQSKAKSPIANDSRARMFDLNDANALDDAIRGCDAVVSLIGTMQKRFAAGDTYASSDVATTRTLVEAATRAGVKQFALLSSVGAGGPGSYLKMKGECESFVTNSSLRWILARPSMLVSPPWAPASHHGTRDPSGALNAFFGITAVLPGLHRWTEKTKPIGIDVVCAAMIDALERDAHQTILEGESLWASAKRAKQLAP